MRFDTYSSVTPFINPFVLSFIRAHRCCLSYLLPRHYINLTSLHFPLSGEVPTPHPFELFHSELTSCVTLTAVLLQERSISCLQKAGSRRIISGGDWLPHLQREMPAEALGVERALPSALLSFMYLLIS